MNWQEVLPQLVSDIEGRDGSWSDVVRRANRISRRQRRKQFAASAVVVAIAAVLVSPALGIGSRLLSLFSGPRYDAVSVTVRLTPSRPVARISRVYDHNTGFARTQLILPRGVAAELLIQTPIEVTTHQSADVHLCTPARRCSANGVRTIITRLCHSTATQTICEERLPEAQQDAIFPPGRYVFIVREFAPRTAVAALHLTFLRG
jgi:phage tail protein X